MLRQRSILNNHFEHIEKTAKDISIYVEDNNHTAFFRSELAGMLNVTIAACYEACIKDILIEYSTVKNNYFGHYVEKQYEKLNSRIKLSDLHDLAELFSLKDRFTQILNKRKQKILYHTKENINIDYANMLEWRNKYAHTYKPLTTLSELLITHRRAKHIIYSFHDTFLA